MIIKKYVVDHMKEAMVRAKYELGPEAIIISEKKVRPGKWYQLFRKSKLEVTVALEDHLHEKSIKDKTEFQSLLNKRVETIKEAAPEDDKSFDTLTHTKAYRIFGKNEKVKDKWKAYAESLGLKENEIRYTDMKDFIEENYEENPFVKELNLNHINVLVGPTGVGKTTTIAKIASIEYLSHGKKVGLLTIDTYRIAAVEQLKKYAEILGIPFETVHEPKEINEKLEKLKDCDLILMDTVGASPKDEDRIEDVKAYIDEIKGEKNIYLTLSMSSDVDTNNAILKSYKSVNYGAMILTKFDEVENYANFWNIMENEILPVQYYCDGQTVPEDIKKSHLPDVLTYLWKEV